MWKSQQLSCVLFLHITMRKWHGSGNCDSAWHCKVRVITRSFWAREIDGGRRVSSKMQEGSTVAPRIQAESKQSLP